MLAGSIHIHKNRFNNSLNILLFILPVFVFALLVAISYVFIIKNYDITNSRILGDEIFNEQTWEYTGQ